MLALAFSRLMPRSVSCFFRSFDLFDGLGVVGLRLLLRFALRLELGGELLVLAQLLIPFFWE
jgi:hypothetical protein